MIQIPEQIPTWWYAVAGAVAAIALLVWLYLLFRAYRTRRAIDAAISSIAYEMLKNVLIPNGNGGQIHVHYLLLTQRGLLVADLLDRPGAIFGGDQMLEWTAIGKKRRYTFANPQHALYDRMAAVRLLLRHKLLASLCSGAHDPAPHLQNELRQRLSPLRRQGGKEGPHQVRS